jgi:hypothetical protein
MGRIRSTSPEGVTITTLKYGDVVTIVGNPGLESQITAFV